MQMQLAADRRTLAQVLINGEVAGFFERSNPRNLPLPNIFGDLGPNEEVQFLLGLCNCMMPNCTNTVFCIIFMRGTVMVGACSEMKRLYICNLMWPQQGCKGARMHEFVFNTLSKAQTRNVPTAWLQVTLDILVEALGRVNFGCVWDFKGLTSPDIKLNGEHRGSFCSIKTHNQIHPG